MNIKNLTQSSFHYKEGMWVNNEVLDVGKYWSDMAAGQCHHVHLSSVCHGTSFILTWVGLHGYKMAANSYHALLNHIKRGGEGITTRRSLKKMRKYNSRNT